MSKSLSWRVSWDGGRSWRSSSVGMMPTERAVRAAYRRALGLRRLPVGFRAVRV